MVKCPKSPKKKHTFSFDYTFSASFKKKISFFDGQKHRFHALFWRKIKNFRAPLARTTKIRVWIDH